MDLHTGDTVKASNVFGRVVEGVVLDQWNVVSGGVCLRVKPEGGSPEVFVAKEVVVRSCPHQLAHEEFSPPE